jgi:hypothetical protein
VVERKDDKKRAIALQDNERRSQQRRVWEKKQAPLLQVIAPIIRLSMVRPLVKRDMRRSVAAMNAKA